MGRMAISVAEDYNQDPWYDNRRSPAEHCLAERFNEEVDFKGAAETKKDQCIDLKIFFWGSASFWGVFIIVPF